MTKNSTVKSQVKEWYVVRIASDLDERDYLKDKSFIGYRFADYGASLSDVIREMVLNHVASDFRGTDAICRFETEAEAKALLVKVLEDFYRENGEDLSGDEFEIVRMVMTVDEQVISKYMREDLTT
ncbi:hypothetical protein [Serratia sp. Se-RSBMAAmG]|uniref:hypothetical protein n=1 Tax=Serratia sp. Se-RSBMAAmG TaxID=3043305 RepID=UPI0024AFF5B0|nr:hypothetical protein [Serratia sp. Se-RSBMAAmG]MDI6976529.1 hypothetical protein [Serratia sp. Se-RSBMAAmG]